MMMMMVMTGAGKSLDFKQTFLGFQHGLSFSVLSGSLGFNVRTVARGTLETQISSSLLFPIRSPFPNLSRFMHIRNLRRARPMLDSKTASTIATSIVQSKLDYCNSLFLNLDSTQIQRLQLIQNSLACAVTRPPRHHHITPA